MPALRSSRSHVVASETSGEAPLFGSVHALDVSKLLKSVHEASGRGGRMPHLLSDIRHRQVILAGKVGEQEKLRKRDITAIELVREVQNAGALRKEDKVRKTIRIRLDCTS